MRIEDEGVGSRKGERLPLREWLARLEAWRILEALERSHGNRSAAARELGIGRRTLYAKLEKLGIAGRSAPRAADDGQGTDDPGSAPSAPSVGTGG